MNEIHKIEVTSDPTTAPVGRTPASRLSECIHRRGEQGAVSWADARTQRMLTKSEDLLSLYGKEPGWQRRRRRRT